MCAPLMSADTNLMPIPGQVDPVPVARETAAVSDGKVNLVGADIMEYAPQNDPVRTFAYYAAGLGWKMLCWLAADVGGHDRRPSVAGHIRLGDMSWTCRTQDTDASYPDT